MEGTQFERIVFPQSDLSKCLHLHLPHIANSINLKQISDREPLTNGQYFDIKFSHDINRIRNDDIPGTCT